MCRSLIHTFFLAVVLTIMAAGCSSETDQMPEAEFKAHSGSQVGLNFKNILSQDEEMNVFKYMYFFNGGGVAVGDFNRDGLEDVFLTSNMGPNALFLNKGNLAFEEVTGKAGIIDQKDAWSSGVTIVDINQDGLLDIYVSVVGNYDVLQGKNELWVCQEITEGIPIFRDEAEAYGLDLSGFGTQALFFDFDRDNDLDFFQLNHSLHQNGTFGRRAELLKEIHPLAGDKLFLNDGGEFVNVTETSGIISSVLGYGLGVAVADIDFDGWPDLYVGNDFHENDYLYLNQGDGTFREALDECIDHTSRFSMGVDIADLNGDGWPEIYTLDMLPEDPYILKSSLGEDGYNIFQFKIGYGYSHQYARNNLQLNLGNGLFSEVGLYADLYATDWSWAPLLIDFDFDGRRDIFVSNGIPRRMNDIDYINFKLGDEDLNWKAENGYMQEDDLNIVDMMPRIKLENRFFKNQGQLKFNSHITIENHYATYSSGAAYADFDLDGDLDIVVNNLEDAPTLYENLAQVDSSQFIKIRFLGPPQNRFGIGARIIVDMGNNRIVQEHYPSRGFQSSSSQVLTVGLGDRSAIQSALLIWPDGTYDTLDIGMRSELVCTWNPNLPDFDFNRFHSPHELDQNWVDRSQDSGLDFEHRENPFVEFNRERLIPHMVSAEGPALAISASDRVESTYAFFGASKFDTSRLYVGSPVKGWTDVTPEHWFGDALYEDVDAAFVDLDNDHDLDLFVASGGNEFRGTSKALQQRYYLNLGNGLWDTARVIPDLFMTASCVLTADVDGDGWMDIFLGGRSISRQYGKLPSSYLYLNDRNGGFMKAQDFHSEEVCQIGMVKDGIWTDLDQDGDPDLILALEWGPVTVLYNEPNGFRQAAIHPAQGWWNFLLPGDFDQDGDIDFIAGNTGQNTRLKPTPEKPVRMYVHDFDDNDQIEQVLTYYLGGKEIPFATYSEVTSQLVSLKKKFLYAKDFAESSLEEIFGADKLSTATIFEVEEFRHMVLWNDGAGGFVAQFLPQEVQYSTVNSGVILNHNGSGGIEVLLAGNFYENNIEMGRYDANKGHLLSIKGQQIEHTYAPIPLKGQIRNMELLNEPKHQILICAKNDAPVQIIEIHTNSKHKNRQQ